MQGFIPGSRGSFMLDVVAIAMVLAIPFMLFGINFAKKLAYRSHKRVMIVLSSLLLIAVVLFEVEMRLIGWEHLASDSPYFGALLYNVLGVHLVFSVTTTLSIGTTVVLALRNFPRMPRPGFHSHKHRFLGKLSAVGLMGTSITGWIFYWMAFVAAKTNS